MNRLVAADARRLKLIAGARRGGLKPAVGYQLLEYVSSIDDSAQPFALWIPRSYSARRKYPLIVALHGSDADHRTIPESCFQIPQRGFREDVILLCPFGRGDIDYRWMGEADLWDTMRLVKERYRVDDRRQYLTGCSMGGYATWRLGCAHPEQWAAIAPVCGGGTLPRVNPLLRMPLWCVHGADDPVVPVDESRRMMKLLSGDPGRHRYTELSGWGHNAWEWLYDWKRSDDTLVDWFLKFRKQHPPAERLSPLRSGTFEDLFGERVIISHPAQSPIPGEVALLREEAGRLARFSFGDMVMRSGRLLVRDDRGLRSEELRSANHIMLGRTDNHQWLHRAARKLLVRHSKGQLWAEGSVYLGKSLIGISCQPSPWNADRLLGVVTYQQVNRLRGCLSKLLGRGAGLGRLNLYDVEQGRMFRQET